MIQFGDYYFYLEAQIIAIEASYDSPTAQYNTDDVYDSTDQTWVSINCQTMSLTCSFGGQVEAVPRIHASAGRLSANLYDPNRILDPTFSPFKLLTKPGAPVRLVAVDSESPDEPYLYDEPTATYDGTAVLSATPIPVWTGRVDSFTHDLLDGSGQLSASDCVADFAGQRVENWVRSAETSTARLLAIRGVMYAPPAYSFKGTAIPLSTATLTGDLWQALGTVGESEQSWLWVDQAGTFRRWSRDATTATPVICSDCDDGTSLIYTALSTEIDEAYIVNQTHTDRVSNTTQRPVRVRGSAQSQGIYGVHSISATTLQLATDTALDTWGQRVLDFRAFPQPRIPSLTFTATATLPWETRCVPKMLALGVTSRLQVHLGSRGSPAQMWDVLVTGISHSFSPTTWTMTCSVVPFNVTGGNTYDEVSALYDTDDRYSISVGPIAAMADSDIFEAVVG